MKFTAIGTTASWVLMGSTVSTSASIVQYGALGLLSFVVVWFCLRGFPIILETQKSERADLKEMIDELRQEIRVLEARNRPKS